MRPPSMPGYTCPIIDKIKAAIVNAQLLASRGRESGDLDDILETLRQIEYELLSEDSRLEEVREANEQLRMCAEYWKDRAEELEREA